MCWPANFGLILGVDVSRVVIFGVCSGDCVRLGDRLVAVDPFRGVFKASSKVSFFLYTIVLVNPRSGLEDELIYKNAGQIRSNNSPSRISLSRIEGSGSEMSRFVRRGAASQVLAGPTVCTI